MKMFPIASDNDACVLRYEAIASTGPLGVEKAIAKKTDLIIMDL
jgi:hypothetical protein